MDDKLRNIKKYSDDAIQTMDKIAEYGEAFWIDYFVYLCKNHKSKDAAVLYNEVLRLFI